MFWLSVPKGQIKFIVVGKEWNGDRRKLSGDIFIYTQKARDNVKGSEWGDKRSTSTTSDKFHQQDCTF